MLLKENSFTKRKYNKMYLSMFLSWSIAVLSEVFDSFAAGVYIDSNAVAAISLITPVQFIIYSFSMLLSFGIGILYNKELGNFNKERSQKIAGMGLLVSVGGGLALMIIILVFANQIVGIYNCSAQIFDYAVIYKDI